MRLQICKLHVSAVLGYFPRTMASYSFHLLTRTLIPSWIDVISAILEMEGFLQIYLFVLQEDCHYECMIDVENLLKMRNKTTVVKYHGKWPFRRVLGGRLFY